jgi:hypothetical protein
VPSPPWIKIIALLTVVAMLAIALVVSLVRGKHLDASTLLLFLGGWSGGVAITTSLLRLVDRRLWRSAPFRWLPNAPPVLHGTWAINITTIRTEDASASARAPTRQNGYLVIEQQLSTILVRVLWEKIGTTKAMHAVLTKREHDWELWYFYDFKPRKYEVESPPEKENPPEAESPPEEENPPEAENPPRRGAATLEVLQQLKKPDGKPVGKLEGKLWKLEGDYWNDIRWTGHVVGEDVVKQTFSNFEEADAHFRPGASSLPSP